MGEVLKAVGAARQMKSNLRGDLGLPSSSGGNYDPGVNMQPLPSLDIAASAGQGLPQISLPQGFAMASPQDQGSTPAPAPTDASQPQQPVDNPYTPDDPKDIANSIGAGNGGPDVTVTGDRWQPKHESLLGKIADTLLVLRGRQPVFRQRTDEANLESAMKGYDRDPMAAISRVNQVDAGTAQKLRESTQRLEEGRAKGYQILGGLSGAIQNSPNPSASFDRMKNTMNHIAGAYQIDRSLIGDTYDASKMSTLNQMGLNPSEQIAAKQGQQRIDQMKQYEDVQTALEKQRLNVETFNAATARMGVDARTAKTNGVTRNIFLSDPKTGENTFKGTMTPDGRSAALLGDDGNWYAFRLKKPGDITSRVYSPNENTMLRAAIAKAMGTTLDENGNIPQ